MNDFEKLLESLVPQKTEETQIPFAPQATMSDDMAQAATIEEMPAAPVRAPAAPMAKPQLSALEEGGQLMSALQNKPLLPVENSSNSSETRTKTSTSGTVPSSDKAEGSMSAEERLEKMMRDLNEGRKKETEEAQSRKFKADIFKIIGDNVGGIVGGAQAMNTKAAVTPIKTQGYDVGDLVGQVEKRFAGDREALMDQYKQLLSARDRSEERKYKQDSLNVERQKLGVQQQLANQKAGKISNVLTPGELKHDEAFAKDYNLLTSKGFTNVESSITNLQKIADELEAEAKSPLGFMVGGGKSSALPNFMRNDDSVRLKNSASKEIFQTLKDLFPGSISDDERKAAAMQVYDDEQGNAENAATIRSYINRAQQNLKDQRRKAEIFSQYGTVSPRVTRESIIPTGNVESSPVEPSQATTKTAPPAGKIAVSNGTETLYIDPSDVADAESDEYMRVK